MSDLLIEPYRPGDEAEMLRLFDRVFGRTRPLAHWHWQFRDNPYGGPFVTLARRASDRELVGQHVVMPFPLNVKGQRVLAGQSLDLAVHPDHRRQGIFERTARDCYARCQEAGMRVLVAFPNESSYPGFVRTLGWERLVVPMHYWKRLGWSGALAKLGLPRGLARWLDAPVRTWIVGASGWGTRAGAGAGKAGFGSSRTVPEGADTLWNGVRSVEVLSTWKDGAYLRWRYDQKPTQEFRHFFIERDGVLIALAVVAVVGAKAFICELMARGRDVATGRLLVSNTLAALAREGVDRIEFLGHDLGFFAEVLAGFRSRTALSNVFVGRALDDDALGALLCRPDNWTLSYGDGDFV